MKKNLQLLLLPVFYLCNLNIAAAQSCTPSPVTKTNPIKVFIHYMPWFTAPDYPVAGTIYPTNETGVTNAWGSHWTNDANNSEDPNDFSTVTNYLGQSVQVRDIISHYHPLIGPYDSKDTNLVEYHLLLMKLSGIDGIIIDWYGDDGVDDHPALLVNSNALIAKTRNAGLKYAIMQEDGEPLTQAEANEDGAYASANYFTDSQYIKLGYLNGTNSTIPLICLFGPSNDATLDNTSSWGTAFGTANLGALLTFMQQSSGLGAQAAGEFAWPQPGNGNNDYTILSNYYTSYSKSRLLLGSGFASFNDFYGPNGTDEDGIIDTAINETNTLSATLALCKTHASSMLGIQLATWNDFTEGTMLEPTVERGFESLATIQQFTGVPFTVNNLEEVYKLFTLRKQYEGNTSIQAALNIASCDFTVLDTLDAQNIIDCIALNGSATNCNSTVPLNLVSFQGKLINGQVQLQWQTTNEINTSHFVVEKSTDGISFTTFATVAAAGSGNNTYTAVDAQPQVGTDYYRLKIIDDNGSFTYSSTVEVQVGTNGTTPFIIYPNPAGNQVQVQYDNNTGNATLRIYNTQGQKVFTASMNGYTKKTIDISQLAAGNYIIEYISDKEIIQKKLIKVD